MFVLCDWHLLLLLAFLWSVYLQLNGWCDAAACITVFIYHSYLLAGFSREHMSLPAEVLPQLLHGAALSGQPEAQRGLWMLCKGRRGSPNVRVQITAAGRMQGEVHLDNVAGNMHEGAQGDIAVSLHTLLTAHSPSPRLLWVLTKHHDESFNPIDLLLFPALPLPCPLLFSPVVREEWAVPQAASAWPVGGTAAETNSIPAAVAEHCKEVSGGGREQRPAGGGRASGHFYMWEAHTSSL